MKKVNFLSRNGQNITISAGSKWMSDDLYQRAGSKNKNFHIVEGANHMQLYDVRKYVDEAVSVLAPFFKENLETLFRAQEA